MKKTRLFLLLLFLTIASWVLWFRYGNVMPEWLSIAMSVWNWLVGPVAVVMMAQFAKEELDFEDPQGLHWIVVRVLVGTPMGCFGVTAIFLGLALLAFALWTLLVEKDPSALPFLLAFGTFVAGIALGGRMLYEAFFRTGPTRREVEEQKRLREERLMNPDWDLFQQVLGRPAPDLMKKHHGRGEEFEYPLPDGENLHITWTPIHRSEILPAEETGADADLFPFAWIVDGGSLFLLPGENTPDRIYFSCEIDGEHVELLAETPEEFFANLEES